MKLLTPKELAAETGIPVSRIYALVERGELAAIRLSPGPGTVRRTRGRIRIQRCDWDDWLQRHRVAAAPDRAASIERAVRQSSIKDLPGAGRYVS